MKAKYIVKRFLFSLLTIFLVMALTFGLVRIMPGNPFSSQNENIKDSEVEALYERYNLNDPIIVQFKDFLINLSHGDLGPSLQKPGVEVVDIIKQGLPISARIGTIAAIIMIILGVSIGLFAALTKNRIVNITYSIISLLGISIPTVVSAPLFYYIFADRLQLIPSLGLDSWQAFIGPSLTLSILPTAVTARLTYVSVNEVIEKNFIKTYVANGLPRHRLIFAHILPNAALPILSYIGPAIASLLTGSFVVEKVFTIPGMGKYFVQSVSTRDYTVIIGVTILYCSLVIGINFIIDVISVFIDPRIAEEEGASHGKE